MKKYKTVAKDDPGNFDLEVNNLVSNGWNLVGFNSCNIAPGWTAFIAFMEKEVGDEFIKAKI